jgi:hypothetical protein
MGMFDYIRYKGHEYQTKDTPHQYMDNYEIRDDGTLWIEKYDSKWVDEPNDWLGGHINHFNHRWEQEKTFTGEIVFYEYDGKGTDIVISSYFVNGELKFITPLKEIRPETVVK